MSTSLVTAHETVLVAFNFLAIRGGPVGSRKHLLCAEAKELVSSVLLCKQEIPSGISKSTGSTALVRRMLLAPSTLLD